MRQDKLNSFNAAQVSEHIINWLRDYALNAKVSGFVVGISGGIDSAVTSALCARTGLPTLLIEMPIHQPIDHVTRGQQHIANLKSEFDNISNTLVDLTDSFETLKRSFETSDNDSRLFLSLANTRSRLRMVTLYYYAGIYGRLVAGTGNKIEDFGVGFYTKYGDGGVDISPIADLLKSEVYALGSYLNVTESIINAKPADGLFHDDRSDEDQLGASYDELEWAMEQTAEGKIPSDYTGREEEVLAIYQRLNRINKHKMEPIPVCKIPDNLKK